MAYLYDVYPPPQRTPDPVWLARCGREGWMAISRDNNIRYKPGERQAILEHRVGAFVLAHKANLTKWPYFKLPVSTLDEMLQRFDETPRPFLYLIGATGTFTRVR